MAILDRSRNVVVLRIVYDGPAESGKTTTVRALSRRLGRPAVTPEEAGGRTLYFDWLDYTAGLFEGYQLRCQVVSVPGQAMLARRREYLLGTADAVVYVTAATASNMQETMRCLKEIQAIANENDQSPVGLLMQVNKRDLPECLPMRKIQSACELDGLNIATIESTATEGIGVREAFVFAVRLALDRVREQIREGTLSEGTSYVDEADALLEHMRHNVIDSAPVERAKPVAPDSENLPVEEAASSVGGSEMEDAATILNKIVQDEQAALSLSKPRIQKDDSEYVPLPPDQRVPSGLIWPAVEGRLHLAQAASEPPKLVRTKGGWRASTQDAWRFYSSSDKRFVDLDEGRASLLDLARAHSTHASLLSSPRCVVLADDGSGAWRLWQLARERLSLRERLASRLDERDPARVVQLLLDTATRLHELDCSVAKMQDSALQVTLDTAGIFCGVTQFIGVISCEMPEGSSPQRLDLEAEMMPLLADWTAVGIDVRGEVEKRVDRTDEDKRDLLEKILSCLTDIG